MNKETQNYLEREKYRVENNVTGQYISLNFITNNKIVFSENKYENNMKMVEYIRNKLRPIRLCLYATKKYHILCDAMTWNVSMITDDLEYFEEETKDNWSGENGKLRNKNCWEVLKEIQSDMNYQSWSELFPNIMNENLKRCS